MKAIINGEELNSSQHHALDEGRVGAALDSVRMCPNVDQNAWCYTFELKGLDLIANKFDASQIAFFLAVALNQAVQQSQDGAAILLCSVTSLEYGYEKAIRAVGLLSHEMQVSINSVKRFGDNNYNDEDDDEIGYYTASLITLTANSKGDRRG